MMTIHRLHAGDGYEYLTRHTACGDRDRAAGQDLTDYYTAHGTPPGRWYGEGAAALGVDGEVTEAQMKALFGEGLHPNADAIIAREIDNGASVTDAIAAAKLGSTFYDFTDTKSPITTALKSKVTAFTAEHKRRPTPTERSELRTDAAREAFTAEHGRTPTRSELVDVLAADKKRTRKAVAGFDCVFTPPKSISILWGLGDAEIRRIITRCHEEARNDTLDWAQQRFALTRRGKDGVRQIDAGGLTMAMFDHWDNRTGDMNPHTHVTISGKVLGSDGKWSALDARPLFGGAVSLSTRYNAAVVGKINRALGIEFEERTRGRGKEPVLEVVGVDDALIDEFSRRASIVARTEELAAQYRKTHGHNPSRIAQVKLAQQATLDTRGDKPVPRSLAELRAEWDRRATQFLGGGRTGSQFVAELHYRYTHPDAPRPFVPDAAALAVGVALGGPKSAAYHDPDVVAAAIEHELARTVFDTPAHRQRAPQLIRDRLDDDRTGGFREPILAAAAAKARTVYDPETILADVAATVERRRSTWTEANVRSAVEERVGVCVFATDVAHRAAVEETVAGMRRRSLAVTIDPDPVPEVMARRSGDSEFTVAGSARFTSETVLAREDRLLRAAHTPTTEFLTGAAVDAAIAHVEKTDKRILNEGQRAIVTHLCTSGQILDVAVGPAGTGKTTAMKAFGYACTQDGRRLVALGPSSTAARVLGDELGVRGRTIHSFLIDAAGNPDEHLPRGAMILLDEMGMVDTPILDRLVSLAARQGAVVKGIGDPYQVSAVDSGGALRLLAADTDAPELREVVRFADADEAAASLAVRTGDADAAWEFYDTRGRVHAGMADELRTHILTAHLADLDAGRTSLMIAATVADTTALNSAAQAARALDGHVRTDGPGADTADGLTAHPGDIVVTRKNAHRFKITGGRRRGTGIDNGDDWTVKNVHQDGSLTLHGRTHRGTVHLPADYVAANVELGYACTVHRTQGRTVSRAYLLMNQTLGRALAYVGVTRASEENHIFVAVDELADSELDRPMDDPITAREAFGSVLARGDDNLTATETIRAEHARIDDPIRLRGIYDHAAGLLADARGRHLLDRALPAVFSQEVFGSPHLQDLLATIAVAHDHGLDTAVLVTSIAGNGVGDLGGSLTDTRDAAAVLRARADRWIDTRIDPASIAPNRDPDKVFRALRDLLSPDGVPAVPSRHTGTNIALSDAAHEIRTRLLHLTGGDAPAVGAARPAATARALNLDPDLTDIVGRLAADLDTLRPGAHTWIDVPHARVDDRDPTVAVAVMSAADADVASSVATETRTVTLDRLAPPYLTAMNYLEQYTAVRAAAVVLPTDRGDLTEDDKWPTLRDALVDVHRAGGDVHGAAVAAADAVEDLHTDDALTDMADRITAHTRDLKAPVPGSLAWIPDAPQPDRHIGTPAHELADTLATQHAAITARVQQLARDTTTEPPAWIDHLGPQPDTATERLRWMLTAAHIAAYREQFAVTDTDPLGAEPAHDHPAASAHRELTARIDVLTSPPVEQHVTSEPTPHPPAAPEPDRTADNDEAREGRRAAERRHAEQRALERERRQQQMRRSQQQRTRGRGI